MTISYEKVAPQEYELSAFVNGYTGEYLFIRRYIGYTKAECTRLFKQALKLAK
jgi:hypothetical protein